MFARDRKTIYVNSSPANRDPGGTSEDFEITDTGETFTNLPKTVKLVTATMPFTWYNIYNINGSQNNHFEFTDSADTLYTFDVPVNNYSGPSMATTLQALMNAEASPDAFTVEFDTATFKFTFTSNNVAGFVLKFDGVVGSMAVPLGFSPTGPDPAKAQVITSITVSKMLIDTELFICSDLVCGSENGVIPWNTSPPDPDLCVLACIPLQACFGAYINYTASPEMPYYPVTQSRFAKVTSPGDNRPRTVRFYLRWPSGVPVDLNGYEWSAQLIFDFNE
jgi:hypothetical protein